MKNQKTIKAGVVVQQEAAPSVRAESGDDDMNDKVHEAATLFLRYRANAMSNILDMCHLVFKSKRDFTKEEFAELCRRIGYAPASSSIRKFEAIGTRYKEFKQYQKSIPDNWTVLYTLTQVPSKKLAKAVKDGLVSNRTTAREIKSKLLPPPKPQQVSAPVQPVSKRGAATVGEVKEPKPRSFMTLNWNGNLDVEAVRRINEQLVALRQEFGNCELVYSEDIEAVLNGAASTHAA